MPKRWDIEKAVLRSTMPSPARLIVLVLAIKSDNETAVVKPEFTPSLATLADMTGIARGSLAEWLNALEVAGWIRRNREAGKGTKTRRTEYVLREGTGEVVLRDRSLRIPKQKRADANADIQATKSDLDEPLKVRDADTSDAPISPRGGHQEVRAADGQAEAESPQGEPLAVREADTQASARRTPNSPPRGHALTTPPPTGEGILKNHQHALATAEAPIGDAAPVAETPEIVSSTPVNAPSIPAQRWTEGDRKPTTPAAVHGRTAALFPAPKPVAVESWMEIHQVIYRWLQANGYDTFSLDEVRQIHTQLIAAFPGKPLRFLTSVIGNGGCGPYAQKIREARNKKIADLVQELQAVSPQCPHGVPAGDQPHPTTGILLCAHCRHGIPAQLVEDTTRPEVQAAIDAYRSRRGNDIYFPELLNVTQQIEAFLAEGATPEQVTTLAEIAGKERISLIQAAAGAAV